MTYQSVQVTCPTCRSRFVTPILSLIDAAQNPEAKAMFLGGRLNVGVCPQCGHAGMLSVPIVYHDGSKELFFAFLPEGLGTSEAERQRLIGDATNRLLSTLPTEQRKGYLLQPRMFMRLEAMVEAILEADGVTPEMLKAHRDRSSLLDRLLRATSDGARRVIAEENDHLVDYQFFQLLAMNRELAEAEGLAEVAAQLSGLQDQLLEWTSFGRETAARREAIESLGPEITREALLEKLIAAALEGEHTKVETMVTVARQAIDYGFFQQLTQRIDTLRQGDQEDQARTLESLRAGILTLVEEIDAEIQKATGSAARLLDEALDSEDPEQFLRSKADLIDELFLSVLGAQLDAARRSGRSGVVERLEGIADILMRLLQEIQPPEIQVINQLMSTTHPEGTQAILEAHARQGSTRDLVRILQLVSDDLEGRGHHEAAEHLAKVRRQAEALLT